MGILQRSPRPSSWVRGGEGDKEGGNWERNGKGTEGRRAGREGKEGGQGRGEGKGGTRLFREKLRSLTDVYTFE